jgi:hypothetical protein
MSALIQNQPFHIIPIYQHTKTKNRFYAAHFNSSHLIDYFLKLDLIKTVIRVDQNKLKFRLQFETEGSKHIFQNNLKRFPLANITIENSINGDYYLVKYDENHIDYIKTAINQSLIAVLKYLSFKKNIGVNSKVSTNTLSFKTYYFNHFKNISL